MVAGDADFDFADRIVAPVRADRPIFGDLLGQLGQGRAVRSCPDAAVERRLPRRAARPAQADAGAGCLHRPAVVAGRKPKDLPAFHRINMVPGNLKTSLAGA